MEFSTILGILSQYGVLVLLVVTFLEALNCPGMPAGVILPAAGMYASHSGASLLHVIALTVLGGMVGSVVLYIVGRVGGQPLLEWLKKRSRHVCRASERCEQVLRDGGFFAVFVGRIVPVVRTIFPLPAGAFRVAVWPFLTASTLGIACYNIVCVGAGYYFGHAFL
ncbi:MAG TPA: DedA family protein [Candidatus Butyricicoccus stercorigallinarum]|nr:DedA family protein [Candidatus Butyricicoccus stercorigallinarum]